MTKSSFLTNPFYSHLTHPSHSCTTGNAVRTTIYNTVLHHMLQCRRSRSQFNKKTHPNVYYDAPNQLNSSSTTPEHLPSHPSPQTTTTLNHNNHTHLMMMKKKMMTNHLLPPTHTHIYHATTILSIHSQQVPTNKSSLSSETPSNNISSPFSSSSQQHPTPTTNA